ncbi:MAG: ferredoxin family protein [Bacillota bacterium]
MVYGKIGSDPLKYVVINPDDKSHIGIENPDTCRDGCPDKPCTFVCPSQVYQWTGDKLVFEYARCVECGACLLACGRNIRWDYPAAGYGVSFKY